MNWRLAAALEKIRAQINAAAPSRSKASDGSIGDAQHASRSSDHNPWVRDGNVGVVTAIDITHDPADGCDAAQIAAAALRDSRTKYVIWNRRIANPDIAGGAWRPYSGSNPHDKHVHISVRPEKRFFDSDAAWDIGALTPDRTAKKPDARPTLRPGSTAPEVQQLQAKLAAMLIAEKNFGPITEAAVRALQASKGAVADGIVGPYTWEHLK